MTYKVELTEQELEDLVTLLGAAVGGFDHLIEDPKTPGIFKSLVKSWKDGAETFQQRLIKLHNGEVS